VVVVLVRQNLSKMNLEEMNLEVLECSRYGEEDDLALLLQNGADVNFQDEAGNTGLHKACANGHVLCLATLKSFGAKHLPNKQGNYPLHWAVQNRKADALKYLVANYEVDMLAQNTFGISTLTEAFQTQDTELIEVCLSHSSSSEEKLIETTGDTATVQQEDADANETGEDGNSEKHAVLHQFGFEGDPTLVPRPVHIRELPISRADNPFGTDVAPEDDTTGLGLWPASVLAAKWALKHWALLENKVVAELGAGCGLPGLAVAVRSKARRVIITDIHEPTLRNALHNVQLNGNGEPAVETVFNFDKSGQTFQVSSSIRSPEVAVGDASSGQDNVCDVSVLKLNWGDETTYPAEKIDVLVGSDLVYDSNILRLLVPAVKNLLGKGWFLSSFN
jgi:predicted nicotinamide N-methyase